MKHLATRARATLTGLALGLTLGLTTTAAQADAAANFPNKPVRIVVTFPPGGSSDAMIRLLAPKMGESLGQQVVVDNRPGAGGNIGLSLVAKAPADGYTLGLGAAGGLAANVSLYPQMPFDPIKDLQPISSVAAIPFLIVAHPSMPATNLKELLAMARSQPGKLTIGHGGNGTAMHLTEALFAQMADIQWTDVAYKGTGPATADALGGQIPLAISDMPAALQLVRTQRLKALAVTSAKRLSALPDVPTVAEAGLPGYESVGWFGMVAPAGTPPAIVKKVHAALQTALNDPATQASIRNLGVEPAGSTPEEFGAFIKSETAKWARVIQKANIKLN